MVQKIGKIVTYDLNYVLDRAVICDTWIVCKWNGKSEKTYE